MKGFLIASAVVTALWGLTIAARQVYHCHVVSRLLADYR